MTRSARQHSRLTRLILTAFSAAGLTSTYPALGEAAAPALTVQAEPAVSSAPKKTLSEYADLSNGEPPTDFFDALASGKILFNNRFRFEFAEIDGAKPSYAITNRIRLGYESQPWNGLNFLVEMENVSSPDENLYFVPATGQGDPGRTVVADPTGTEVNQAYFRYNTKSLSETDISLDFKAGRQRTILDDSRFVGNVGWRQFEQTLDSVSFKSNLGIDQLAVYYAYVWRVQRIFGPDGPNFDSNSHLVNVAYRVIPELTITPFVYLLDFDNSALNSNASYGVRLHGKVGLEEPTDVKGLRFDYDFTYAFQTDFANNPVSYDANFVGVDLGLALKGTGKVGVGYQLLGSDDGNFGFRFPLGTNHKFQGWADVFLVTPAAGVQDLYVYLNGDLPYDVKGRLVFHKFYSDEGGADFGWEVDARLTKKITENLSVLAKVAYYNGDGGPFADRVRVWTQLTLSF